MKNYWIALLAVVMSPSAFSQKSDLRILDNTGEKYRIYMDSVMHYGEVFLEAFPNDFETFYELYGKLESPLYPKYKEHMDILESYPRDSILFSKLIDLSIGAKRYADAPTMLWELSRFSFVKNKENYSKVLNRFTVNEIASVFTFFEKGISSVRQLKEADIKPLKEKYPKVYKGFIEMKKGMN